MNGSTLRLPHSETPLVSVIIPVFGNFDLTLACLASIARHPPAAAIETIVADDASDPAGLASLRQIDGIRLLDGGENLGFVGNCNRAALQARRPYLMFLNNDTEVTEGWLDPLIEVFRERPDAAIVGAKLLFPDGTLQQAGGIVWRDGSASHYGRGDDPARPAYNYLREVDYCSGAALLVERAFFEAQGGFDPLYAPAYYEDTDLAMKARAVGRKVYYQPRSVIVHHEGRTHGTDTGSGVKAYQVRNQAVFAARWRQVLESRHFPHGGPMFRARERGDNCGTVLVIDRMAPQPDRDAGSRNTANHLEALLAAGYHVKFCAQDRVFDQAYTPPWQGRGIEMLYGNAAAGAGFRDWLREAGSHLHAVVVNRPEVAIEYLPDLRRLTRARLVYYGHDLHHRRLEMQAEVTGSRMFAKLAAAMRGWEEEIWTEVDFVAYPSPEEVAAVREHDPGIAAGVVTPFVFDTFLEAAEFDGRADVLFVGGFGFAPNIDAALWLVRRIMPLVWLTRPETRLTIVGDAPTRDIAALAGDRVTVTGWITDDRLAAYYRSARVAVVPLRFGAGVKSKTVDALRYGVPLVTTPVGAQGLPGVEAVADIGTEAEPIANAILRLLQDDAAWRQRSAAQMAFARERFAAVRLKRELVGAIDGEGRPGRTELPMPADSYRRWIANRASAATARPDWVAERVREWPHVPKLALGMIVPAVDEARIAATLTSLAAQTVGEWELHVVAHGAMPAALAPERRLLWHFGDGPAAALLSRNLVQSEPHWIALIDAGDRLAPHALFSLADAGFRHPEWQAVYSDEDNIDAEERRSAPHFKAGFNLDLLRSMPYVGGLLAVRRETFVAIGGFDPGREGLEEYDLALRIAERAGADGFGHIADVLYHRAVGSGRTARPAAEILRDLPKTVQAHLDRLRVTATAEPGLRPYTCRVRYRHDGADPSVSIVVPAENDAFLKRCLDAVLRRTDYANYELLVIAGGDLGPEISAVLNALPDLAAGSGKSVRVLQGPADEMRSAPYNRVAATEAAGDFLCFLSPYTAPSDPGWLDEMMSLVRRDDVGAVGAKLFYTGGRVQHGGVYLGAAGETSEGNPYNGEAGEALGYWGRLQLVQDLSAVSAACLLTCRVLFQRFGGFEAARYDAQAAGVEYALRLREAGYLVVWTPFAQLRHDPPPSNGSASPTENTASAYEWMARAARDPAYNRNLSPQGHGFAIETEAAPTWESEFRPRPRIVVHPADRDACGEYRIIAPSRALFGSGRVQCCEAGRVLNPLEMMRATPNAVVFQRHLELGQIAAMARLAEASPAFRVFEIDDLVTDLPPESPHRRSMPADVGERLKQAAGLCQRLVVSTRPLADRYGGLCGETVVLPNRLERARWGGLVPERRQRAKARVGWAGAIGHPGDLALVAELVELTSAEVDWVFLGLCPQALRRHVAEFHGWVLLHEYPQKLAALDLDLAVAPLQLHPFNEAKSNLRLLEYGVLGYPVLCSDITPYRGGLPVFRVQNRATDWLKALRDLVNDRDACRRAGDALREAVLRDWMLEDHLGEVERAWLPG